MVAYRFPWGVSDEAEVWVVHLGSKSTPMVLQLCREIGVRSHLLELGELAGAVRKSQPRVLIFSGSPSGVYEKDTPFISRAMIKSLVADGVIIVGICYGAQLLAHIFGGEVRHAAQMESGIVRLKLQKGACVGYKGGRVVMNHCDEVVRLPSSWRNWGSTPDCQYAFFGTESIYCMQFHPEMDQTEQGEELLSRIIFFRAGCRKNYAFDEAMFVVQACEFIRASAKRRGVIVGMSGGVDSATAWMIARRALGDKKVHALFIDNGFLREGEREEIDRNFNAPFAERVQCIDAREVFYSAVERIPHDGDDEQYFVHVRAVMGKTFGDIFLHAAGQHRRNSLLMQGTNYSDIIESATGFVQHHNTVEIPMDVVEPLAGLYKFEIRKIAAYLGLPQEVVWRQPSPGPGNALRKVHGPVTRADAAALGKANRILHETVEKYYPDFAKRPSQYYAAIDSRVRALVGDERVYGYRWRVRSVKAGGRESYATMSGFRLSSRCKQELEYRLLREVRLPDAPFVSIEYAEGGKPPLAVEIH